MCRSAEIGPGLPGEHYARNLMATTFATDTGVEVPAVTTEQMREIDRIATEEMGPNLYQMMENAGRSLALTVLDILGIEWASSPIVVLAGRGGNGGGGICAARHLANRGAEVTVVVSDPEGLNPVPRAQLGTYQLTGGKLASLDQLDNLTAAVVVDSIIGYSLKGAPTGVPEAMIGWIGTQAAPVVCLDVPSGIDATTGEAAGAHVRGSATLTLALPKTGLRVDTAGDMFLADIGIPNEVYRRIGLDVSTEIFKDRYRVSVRPR